MQRQRQYDVGKLFHRGDKDSGKWRENEMNGVIFMLRRGRLLWIWMKIREGKGKAEGTIQIYVTCFVVGIRLKMQENCTSWFMCLV
ncbi:hypothetical protein DWX15_20295 [Bacteroides sp. AF18-33]|nr:hypothetical protein DWX15_20295 [Bacteroides sp. AF18-33]